MLGLTLGLLVVPATTYAHSKGCHTKACDHRVGRSVRWLPAGATTFGGPADSGTTGTTGYRGDDLSVLWQSYAELGNGCALGCLAHNSRIRVLIPSTGKRLTLAHRDIGLGGGPIAGLPRLIDLWWMAARYLGVGNAWSGRILYRRIHLATRRVYR